MITIEMQGGLGNQLFSFALGEALSFHGHEVQYDKTPLETGSRSYLLADLGLNLPFGEPTGEHLHEGEHKYHSWVFGLDPKKDYTLHGYWQSEKYFQFISDIIKQKVFQNLQLSSKTRSVAFEIAGRKGIFVHVRRSDNLSIRGMSFHGLIGLDYYEKAMSYWRNHPTEIKMTSAIPESNTFFIFSDDPEWCKQQKLFKDCQIVDHNGWSGTVDSEGIITRSKGREVEDLYLMSLCKAGVVSNSTFSWWAAFLGPDRAIVPKNFFRNMTNPDLIPHRWFKI